MVSEPQPLAVRRLSIAGVVIASLFVAMFARLGYLQVIEGSALASASQKNQVRIVYDKAPRGRILDRNGQLLAANREADVIAVERTALQKDPTLLARLATFLQTTEVDLRARVNDSKASLYRPVVVADNVAPEVIAAFRERATDFTGATAEPQIQRWYPGGTLAAHLLGYTGEINDKELADHKDDYHKDDGKSDYRLGDEIGKTGLEAAYEKQLRGIPGVTKVEVDAKGRAVRVLERVAPIPGNDLHLFLDKHVQLAAEDSLVKGLDLARQTATPETAVKTVAEKGAVVALDPSNGGIVAMASFPTFDPSSFAKSIPASEYAQLTDPNGPLPFNNRAVQGQYAPGSTFKLITSIAALKSGIIDANTTMNDTGSFILGGRRFQNAQGKSYGSVNLQRSLTVSSDVFYYNLGARAWEARKRVGDPIQQSARDFGLGERTKVGLASEGAGRVPDPDSRKKLHQELPKAYPEGNWYAGDNVNLAIGQGDALVTPLQLANAYAAFSTGGDLRRPRIVNSVTAPDGKVVSATDDEIIRHIDLPENVRQPVEAGLVGAVQEPTGTAFSAFSGFDLNAFPIAGKTGTAQVTGKQDSALFAAYGPVGAPKIAVSVVLEEAGWGGTAAAPVARRVMAASAGQPIEALRLGTGTD